MEPTITIDGSNCVSYDNALHAQFHNRMYAIITSRDTTKLNLTDELTDQWKECIDTCIDISREVTASQETKLMVEKDVERDNHITYLFQTIRNEALSPIKARQEAAQRLLLIVNKYKGLQNESFDQETIHIISLVVDLSKPANAADCNTLALTPIITMLNDVNTEYQTIRSRRTGDRATSKLPTSKEMRLKTDTFYNRICKLIEATYLLSSVEADRKLIADLVLEMNQFIVEIKATYHQSQSQKAAAKSRAEAKKATEQE